MMARRQRRSRGQLAATVAAVAVVAVVLACRPPAAAATATAPQQSTDATKAKVGEDSRFVTQPPLVCPVVTLKGINTVFVHAGQLTAEAAALRDAVAALVARYNGSSPAAVNGPLNAAAGEAAVTEAGLGRVTGTATDALFVDAASVPSPAALAAADIVVYMDMLPPTVPAATLAACPAMGKALAAWYGAREARDIIVDGRALSMTTGGAVTPEGRAELTAEWTQLATRGGGLLLLGHNGAHQACITAVMPELGLMPLRPDTAPPGVVVPIPANERAYSSYHWEARP